MPDFPIHSGEPQIKPVVQEQHIRKATMTLTSYQVCAILAKYVGQEAGMNPAGSNVTEKIGFDCRGGAFFGATVELTEDLMADREPVVK